MGRYGVALPAIVVLAALAAVSLRFLQADAPLRRASDEISAWNAARLQPAASTWESVRDDLARAIELVPGNPGAHELMGHLNARRQDAAGYGQRAFEHLSRALVLRPMSPYAWASLAEARYLHGDTGAVFEHALTHAARLGPAEPGVQRLVANYGLAVWDEVGEPTRKAIDRMVAAGVRRNTGEMLQIAERRGRLPVACRHLEGPTRTPDSKWLQLCRSTGATS